MKKNYKRIYKKMDLRISPLDFNFVMIYIIHKIFRTRMKLGTAIPYIKKIQKMYDESPDTLLELC